MSDGQLQVKFSPIIKHDVMFFQNKNTANLALQVSFLLLIGRLVCPRANLRILGGM